MHTLLSRYTASNMGRVAVYPLRRQRHSSLFFRAQKDKNEKYTLPNFRRVYFCIKRRWMIMMSLLSLHRRADNDVTGQGIQAKQSSSSQRQQQQQQRPALHESTIRNILLPKFKSSSSSSSSSTNSAPPDNNNSLQSGNHTKNVAIIVSSSRYWFNYRHVTSALSIYQLLKQATSY